VLIFVRNLITHNVSDERRLHGPRRATKLATGSRLEYTIRYRRPLDRLVGLEFDSNKMGRPCLALAMEFEPFSELL
jgi:hypothetical protein